MRYKIKNKTLSFVNEHINLVNIVCKLNNQSESNNIIIEEEYIPLNINWPVSWKTLSE